MKITVRAILLMLLLAYFLVLYRDGYMMRNNE